MTLSESLQLAHSESPTNASHVIFQESVDFVSSFLRVHATTRLRNSSNLPMQYSDHGQRLIPPINRIIKNGTVLPRG